MATGVGELIVLPLTDGSGDSWIRRLINGAAIAKQSGNALDILNQTGDGRNAAVVAVMQMKQNAPTAIGTVVGFGIGAALLSFFGM